MDHADVVARIKATLEAKGINLKGPDGAFEITKRVAWALRAEGAGLLDKPAGNNSHGYATDIICYPDGHHFDILTDGGNTNGPQWSDAGFVDASRYRPAIDPVDDPAPAEAPQWSAAPPVDALSAKVDAIAALLASLDRKLDALARQSDANTEKLQQQIDQVVNEAKKAAAAALPLLSGILGKR
jgi:hypothetical protein